MSGYICFKDIKKTYEMGEVTIKAVDGVSFDIHKGEFVIIAGSSGAGKSTVLNLLGGMDIPSSGDLMVDGTNISKFSKKQLTNYRKDDIGFVFQFYNLVQNLTVRENVELATQLIKNPLDIEEILDEVGLNDRKNNFPSQLSGGEQQRVAIARAIAKNPKLLLCDEPTGALDYNTGKAVLSLLQKMCRQMHMTVVVITHNLALTPMGDKVIHMKNGQVEKMIINPEPTPVERIEW
ncbi:MAG: ABC transporter ATP-binding protein [Cellulosilyticaceae bacterium]